MNAKFLVGGLLGGIVLFLLGWVVYDMVLGATAEGYSNMNCMRSKEDFNMLLMAVANLLYGYLLAYVLSNSGSMSSFAGGAKAGAIVGFLACLSIDLMFYSFTTIWNDYTWIIIDVVAWTVISAIAGGVIGWWMGRE